MKDKKKENEYNTGKGNSPINPENKRKKINPVSFILATWNTYLSHLPGFAGRLYRIPYAVCT